MPQLKKVNHEIFARNVVKNKGHLTKAYQETRPEISYETANREASRLFHNPIINNRIFELLNESKLDLPSLTKKLESLVNHQKAIINNGKIEYVPDGAIQADSVKTAFKLHGLLSNSNVDIEDNRSVNITISDKNSEQLQSTLDKLEAMTNKLSNNKIDYRNMSSGNQLEEVIDI